MLTPTVYLMFWAVVAATGNAAVHEWRPLGEFASPADCDRAAKRLGLERFQCVETGRTQLQLTTPKAAHDR